MPAPHHSVFYRPDALPAAQPTASMPSTRGIEYLTLYWRARNRSSIPGVGSVYTAAGWRGGRETDVLMDTWLSPH